MSSVGEMLDELEWSSLEARKDQSSLLLFHKIHCGAVSIRNDMYMTSAHSLKTTRSSHSAQPYQLDKSRFFSFRQEHDMSPGDHALVGSNILVSMIRKYHIHKLKTNQWHREEEPHDNHQTIGRQTKQSNQFLFVVGHPVPIQCFFLNWHHFFQGRICLKFL